MSTFTLKSVVPKTLLTIGLIYLTACQSESPNTAPQSSASPSATPSVSASPSAAASTLPAATPTETDPPAEIRRIAECVNNSGTAAASTSSTISDRATLAQMAMSQGNLAQAQQQLEFVRNSVRNLETQYGFKCVN